MTLPLPQDLELEDPQEKSKRGFEPEELRAVVVAVVVGLVPILMTVVTYSLDDTAVWPMGIGAALVALGLWGGIRGAVGAGVLLLAVAGMVMTHDATAIGLALLGNGVIIALCVLILGGADMSFVMRRGSHVAAETVQGFALVHAVALAVGVGSSAVVVGSVEAIDWPSWLIVVPIAGLTLAALFLARWVRKFRTSVRSADAPVVGRGPVAPPSNALWREFKWQSVDDT